MAYRIEAGEPAAEALRRIAREALSEAREELGGDDPHEAVHEARKRCKKLRGLLRLLRPALGSTYGEENARLRDAARELSELRDATTRIESLDGLRARHGDALEGARELRAALLERREELAAREELWARLERFDEALAAAERRVEGWELEGSARRAIAEGCERTYARGARALVRARGEPTTEALHEWRKRVKYHRYHLRLLRRAWRPVLAARAESADRLGDLLGDDHDLAVLRAALVGEARRFGGEGRLTATLALIDLRRKELQGWALPLGARLFAEEPGAWRARLERVLAAWREEQRLAAALPARSREVLT